MAGPALAGDIWPGPRWAHLLIAGVALMVSLFLLRILLRYARLVAAAFRMHTVVGRDGFSTHPAGGPVPVRWPESRSGLFAQSVGLGTLATVVVEGWAVTPEGGCGSLPGTRRVGPVAQRGLCCGRSSPSSMRSGSGACATERRGSPVGISLCVTGCASSSARAPRRVDGIRFLRATVPLGLPSVPVATGSSEGRLVLEARGHQSFSWTECQRWLLALG